MTEYKDNFESFEYETDGTHDYFDDRMSAASDEEHGFRESMLCSYWMDRKADTEKSVYDMLRIRDAVHSFIKVHGVPTDTRVEVATLGKDTSGCCTFSDLTNFKRPVILLDKSIYELCEDRFEMMDVYCGIGLHEASHANHTRKLFGWIKDKKFTTKLMEIFAGLWEDERIEALARQESPGFAPYIQATKRVLFEKQELGCALNSFDTAVDLDRLLLTIFCFIRTPYLITDSIKKFTLIDDSCPYSDLRRMFGSFPEHEGDVLKYSRKLHRYWNRKKKLYVDDTSSKKDDPGSGISGDAGGGGGDSEPTDSAGDEGTSDTSSGKVGDDSATDCTSRKEDQQEVLEEDERLSELATKTKKLVKEMTGPRRSRSVEDRTEKAISEGDIDSAKDLQDELKSITDRAAKTSDIKKRESRFAEVELEKMMDRFQSVTNPLNADESIELCKAAKNRISFQDDWKSPSHGRDNSSRRNIVIHPPVTPAAESRYKEFYNLVRPNIARMRNVLQFRLGTRNFKDTEKKRGRVHRRRLARCKSTDRIFYAKRQRTDRGVAIGLLLDESGSMGEMYHGCSTNKASKAIQVAILLAEALRYTSGVEFEAYSYGSAGTLDENNRIKYLYGKNNPNIFGIGNYEGSCQNYDHVAIETAADLLTANTDNPNRILLIVSDGAPAGHLYGGALAREATRKSVKQVEMRGIKVVHVAIEAFKASDMFDTTFEFTDLNSLVNQMRRLTTRLVMRM